MRKNSAKDHPLVIGSESISVMVVFVVVVLLVFFVHVPVLVSV